MSLFPLTNSEIAFFWYGFKHEFVNLEHTVLRALSRLLVSAILFYLSTAPFAWKAPCGLLGGQGQLSRIRKVQCDWLSMFLVEQAFLGREEIQAPLKTPAGWGGGRVPLMGTIPGIFNEGRGTWQWVLEVWVSGAVWGHPPSNFEIYRLWSLYLSCPWNTGQVFIQALYVWEESTCWEKC